MDPIAAAVLSSWTLDLKTVCLLLAVGALYFRGWRRVHSELPRKYTVGKLAILKLREDYKRYRGKEFSLQEFHDKLLSDGIAPLWVHRQMLMPDDKGKLLE